MIKSDDVKQTLSGPTVHDGWEKNYRNKENEMFFKIAFEYISKVLGSPKKESVLLDAGCGSCRHTMRMAKYGFNVVAVDYSPHIVKVAQQVIKDQGLNDQVKVKQDSLLNLSFENETFDYVLCWGVLMHIPDIDLAISELVRVLNKSGKLILSEVNMSSLEVKVIEFLRPFLNKKDIRSIKTNRGVEVWSKTESGELLSRRVNIPWLIDRLKSEGLTVINRKSGQFTESYTRFSNKLVNRLIHKFNNIWFKYINLPSLACGNIIILEKKR